MMPDRQLASQPDLLDPEAERRILRCSSVDPFLPLMFLGLPDPDPSVRSTDPDPAQAKII